MEVTLKTLRIIQYCLFENYKPIKSLKVNPMSSQIKFKTKHIIVFIHEFLTGNV